MIDCLGGLALCQERSRKTVERNLEFWSLFFLSIRKGLFTAVGTAGYAGGMAAMSLRLLSAPL